MIPFGFSVYESQPENRTMIDPQPVLAPTQYQQPETAPPEIPVPVQLQQSVGSAEQPSQTDELSTGMRIAFNQDGMAICDPISQAIVVGGEGSAAISGGGIMYVQGGEPRRKRGRPRKYGSVGNLIMAGLPPGDLPPASAMGSKKRYRKNKKLEDAAGCFAAEHIYVEEGEDIASKIVSFCQRSGMSMCIISATGKISSVVLREPSTCNGTLMYEGNFDIISLKGSFVRTEHEGQTFTRGALSISLFGHDKLVVGGGVAGSLTAATSVKVFMRLFDANASDEANSTGHAFEPEPETPMPVPNGAKEVLADNPPSSIVPY